MFVRLFTICKLYCKGNPIYDTQTSELFSLQIDPVSTRQFTFREVKEYITNAAGALYRRGLRKGDVVCLCLPNMIEYPIAFHAVVALGAIVTTVNPLYTAGQLSII